MKNIITAILVLASLNLSAQGWYKNMEKYWWYRYRLVNDFMKIGEGPGESIPAQNRQHLEGSVWNSSTGWDGNGLGWEEGTILLGHYIGSLAVEYRMLKDNGWDTRRTEKELDYALKAFNRLDRNAETFSEDPDRFPYHPLTWTPSDVTFNNSPSSLNGFFLRDDVPFDNQPDVVFPDFVKKNAEHFNRPGIHYNPDPSLKGAFSICPPNFSNRVDNVQNSSFKGSTPMPSTGWPPPGMPASLPRYPNLESQDQATDIFLGLSLATGLLDYGMSSTGMDLKLTATDAAYRTVSWFCKPGYYSTETSEVLAHAAFLSPPYDWVLKNPLTKKCVINGDPANYGTTHCFDGAIGPSTYAPSIALASKKAVGAKYSAYDPLCDDLVNRVNWKHNLVFQGFQFFPTWMTYGTRDLGFPLSYTTVSNAWNIGPINTSWKTIRDRSVNEHFSMPHLPLIYRIHHSRTGTGMDPSFYVKHADGMTYEYLLDRAPLCGPFCYRKDDNNGFYLSREWSGGDRLSEWYHRQDYSYPNMGVGNADYNGLDYIMLFGLYSYHIFGYLHYLIDPYYTADFSTNYPDMAGLGSHSTKLKLNWLEYISYKNTISPSGNVTFRAAHEQDMLPGFDAQPGSVFEAYVQDYVCHGYNGEYHYAEVNGEYFEYTPNPRPFFPKPGENIKDSITRVEDSLADVPVPEEYLDAFRDSLNHYLDEFTDSTIINFYTKLGLMTPDGAYRRGTSLVPDGPITYGKWVDIYPNPAQNATKVIYQIFEPSNINISVANTLGQEFNQCIEPYEPQQSSGKHTISINTEQLTPGMYYVRIQIGNQLVVKKLTVM